LRGDLFSSEWEALAAHYPPLGLSLSQKSGLSSYENYKSWSYAIKGKTDEGRWLRVVVAIEDNLCVITIIDLEGVL